MAPPESQDTWLKAAKGTQNELISEVKKAKRAAKVDPGQGELMLESLAALLETREMEVADEAAAKIKPHKTEQSGTPRGDFSSRPPVQIHVHEDAKTGRKTW